MPEFLADEIADACNKGDLIVHGPLNTCYRVTLDGEQYFVRQRHVTDPEYGQTFAAEQYLQEFFAHAAVHVPRLFAVTSAAAGRGQFAVFEYIEGEEPDWNCQETLRQCADALRTVHSVPASHFGPLAGGPRALVPAEAFIAGLVERELQQLGAHPLHAKQRQLTEAAECFVGAEPTLVHGDVHRGNWLRARSGELFLVDWEAARWRLPCADFNQLHYQWLQPAQERHLIAAYGNHVLNRTHLTQIAILRVLWHLRTYNFYTLVLREKPSRHAEHLALAERITYELLKEA